MLEWQLKYGEKIEWLQDLTAEGHDISAIKNQPVLYDDLIPDYEAFVTLSKHRTEMGAIPLSEILAYMKLHGIDDYKEQQLFLKRIEFLDNQYLKLKAEQNNGSPRN